MEISCKYFKKIEFIVERISFHLESLNFSIVIPHFWKKKLNDRLTGTKNSYIIQVNQLILVILSFKFFMKLTDIMRNSGLLLKIFFTNAIYGRE